jgi:hypothetical protein
MQQPRKSTVIKIEGFSNANSFWHLQNWWLCLMPAAHYATRPGASESQASCKGIASLAINAAAHYATRLDLIMRSLTGKRIAHVFI